LNRQQQIFFTKKQHDIAYQGEEKIQITGMEENKMGKV
jgi:hypothetical protein